MVRAKWKQLRRTQFLARTFPELRIFIRSDADTRFVRVGPWAQLSAYVGMTFLVAWAIVAAAVILLDSIGSGNFREQALRDQQIYQTRLNAISQERDQRLYEAVAAQNRFGMALSELGRMQEELLHSETRREELERGIRSVQTKLSDALQQKRELSAQWQAVQANGGAAQMSNSDEMLLKTLYQTIEDLSVERDAHAQTAHDADAKYQDVALEMELMQERNDQIFRQIEDALTVSLDPLSKMFRSAGVDPNGLIDSVKKGYSGFGGPDLPDHILEDAAASTDLQRAQRILADLDRVNLYRIAAEALPFDHPVKSGYRYTSGFGRRWGRLHAGSDFAGPVGTPVYTTGDGQVTFAGWLSGYGRVIKIQHANGIETRYAHLNKIRVNKGQRVSRGDRIGDMGNTGRSTGPHLHYEVRVNGAPIDPMKFIKAGRNVF